MPQFGRYPGVADMGHHHPGVVHLQFPSTTSAKVHTNVISAKIADHTMVCNPIDSRTVPTALAL